MSGEGGGKRTLSLTEHLYPVVGGGEISLLRVLRHLAGRGPVEAHCQGRADARAQEGAVRIHVHRLAGATSSMAAAARLHWVDLTSRKRAFEAVARAAVKDLGPDLVVTQLNFTTEAVAAAREAGVPAVVFLRSPEFVCPMSFTTRPSSECTGDWRECLPLGARLQTPWVRRWIEGLRGALAEADLVVANSQWMASLAERHLGLDARVVHPPVDPKDVRPARWEPEYVLYMGQLAHKGLDTFLAVAEALPEHRFVVCGRQSKDHQRHIGALRNVEYWGWTERRRALSGARLVLVPSSWEEPFGRVPVEAGAVGIPSVATECGGLPEAVGEGGLLVKSATAVKAWVMATRTLMEDEAQWEELSRLAREHSERFEPQVVLSRLDALLEPLLDR